LFSHARTPLLGVFSPPSVVDLQPPSRNGANLRNNGRRASMVNPRFPSCNCTRFHLSYANISGGMERCVRGSFWQLV
jgi:hypothetical protein